MHNTAINESLDALTFRRFTAFFPNLRDLICYYRSLTRFAFVCTGLRCFAQEII